MPVMRFDGTACDRARPTRRGSRSEATTEKSSPTVSMQSCQVVIRNESEILNVGMSKPPKVASRPGAKTIKKNTNSTQNKSQTHRAKQYEVT